jgi:hypothetical protein
VSGSACQRLALRVRSFAGNDSNMQQRHGVARLTDAVIEQLRTLHPQNDTALSAAEEALLTRNLRSTTPLATVDPARLASIIARKVNNGSAPGPSGWTGHHLHVLMEDEDCAKGITALITDIRNGALTGRDVRNRLLASALIPISKPNGSLRPIAMCETFYKTAALYAMSEVQEELPKLFPRIQFGVATPGGSERAAHLITNTRALMSASRSDIIVLSTDFKNAFNAASCAQVRRAVLGNERCRPLWRLFEYASARAASCMCTPRAPATWCPPSRRAAGFGRATHWRHSPSPCASSRCMSG